SFAVRYRQHRWWSGKERSLPLPMLTSLRPPEAVARPVLRIARKGEETSQGKTLIFPSVAAGSTCASVRLAIGHPRPLPGYPTAPAFYPVSVRRLRVWPQASFPPRLATTQLPSANGSGQSARRGLAPPRSSPCLAHKTDRPRVSGAF